MLAIFKSYETDMSILDDFDFYEDRQKALQERKARQQNTLMAVGVVGETEHRTSSNFNGDFIKQLPKSFAQVVRLDDGSNDVGRANAVSDVGRANAVSEGSIGTVVEPEDSISATASFPAS